jgi:hypothetical protein
VAHTVEKQEAVDEEMRHLMAVLRGRAVGKVG